MKKITLLIATLLAAFTFASCDKENNGGAEPNIEPTISYPYSYYEPYLMWGDTQEEVKQFMSSTYPSWKLDAGSSSDNTLYYIDSKYSTINMSYSFSNGKLESSSILYPLQSDAFDTFKSDIEERYKVEMEWKGNYYGSDVYSAHSDMRNMDISLSNAKSMELFRMISATFRGTGPAPSDKIKFEITPSNKATLNYTELLNILLTFPEAKEVALYEEFAKIKTISLVDSQGEKIWEIVAKSYSQNISIEGNAIKLHIPIYMYDKLTSEGDYTLEIKPNTIVVDGRMLTEQHIKYHLTATRPILEPFELKFDSNVTNTDELHFYLPDGVDFGGCNFYGNTPIYDEDGNTVGKVYNFRSIDDRHFYLELRMETTDKTKKYHLDLAEGLIIGYTQFGNIPSAAATITFGL